MFDFVEKYKRDRLWRQLESVAARLRDLEEVRPQIDGHQWPDMAYEIDGDIDRLRERVRALKSKLAPHYTA